MFQNMLGCLLIFILSALLAWLTGAYMNKVYRSDKSLLDFLRPFENFIFKICRIDPSKEMKWKQYLIAMAVINLVWLVGWVNGQTTILPWAADMKKIENKVALAVNFRL